MYSRINWEVIINQEMIIYQRKRGKLIMSKAELAIEKKYNGKCNCAQAVACSFCKEASMDSFAEEAGVDEETLKAATQAFGVGLATMEGNCGALSGAAMVLGLIHKDRKKTTEDIRAIMTEFKETYGTVVCKELKGVETGKVILPCDDCIRAAAELLEKQLG